MKLKRRKGREKCWHKIFFLLLKYIYSSRTHCSDLLGKMESGFIRLSVYPGLALLLVIVMLACACLYNYICTGRCAVEEEGEEGMEGEGEGPGEGTALSSRYNGMPQHHQQQQRQQRRQRQH